MKANLLRFFAAALTGLFLIGAYAQEAPTTQEDCDAAGGQWDDATQTCTMTEQQ
jgi:hypothetical protein